MATMIIRIPDFTLTSSWRGTTRSQGTIYYETPSYASTRKTFELSSIPLGSTIQSAFLEVDASAGYSGGSIRVNGSAILSQDVSSLVRPNAVGNFTEITIPFSYQAYGGMGGSGTHYSRCSFSSVVMTIEYESGEGEAVDPESFRTASLAIARDIRPRAVITYPSGAQQPIGTDQIIRFTINEGVKTGILLGAVSSSVLELRLANDAGQWNPGGAMRGTRTPLGAKVSMSIGLKIDGEWVYSQAGVYNIESFTGKATEPAITLKGYDDMAYAFEKPFVDGLTYPAALYEVLSHISERAGIGYVGNLTANGDVAIPSKPDWGDECTLRQALSWVCQAGASYGQVDRRGRLTIRPTWETDQRLSLTPESYMESTHDERRLKFNTIRIQTADGKELSSSVNSAIGPNASNTVEISGNPLFVSTQPIAQTMADGIKNALENGEWRASDFRWRGDPSVTLGCYVDVAERSGDKFFTTICNQSIRWDQGFSMTGKCEIDIDRDFADLGYDEATIGGLPAGTKILITEGDGTAWYTIVDTDYDGAVLLWRDEISGTSRYHFSAPSNASSNKYENSSLDSGMRTFANNLPDNTKSILLEVNVPLRANAQTGAAATLTRNSFAISAKELGLSTTEVEGEILDYLGTIQTNSIYWTREASGGSASSAYAVTAEGTRRSDTVTSARGLRPALSVYKNTPVHAIDGGFAPIILENVSENGDTFDSEVELITVGMLLKDGEI